MGASIWVGVGPEKEALLTRMYTDNHRSTQMFFDFAGV